MSDTLALLAKYADICRDAAKYTDPAECAKAAEQWLVKLPANQQRLVREFLPHAAAIAKKVQERRVPRI